MGAAAAAHEFQAPIANTSDWPAIQSPSGCYGPETVALQDNTLGIQPEEVLVLETVGSISDFIKAVGKIEGLEWLGEFESDPIDPGEGFEDPKDADKQLMGQLFLVMTDQQALQQMLGYFNQWRENQT